MLHWCNGCGKLWDGSQLRYIKDYLERLEPGGVVPSGECPDCGALCYPDKQRPTTAELQQLKVKRLLPRAIMIANLVLLVSGFVLLGVGTGDVCITVGACFLALYAKSRNHKE